MAQSREIEKLQRRWQENPLGLTFAPLAEAYRKEGLYADALELLEIGLAQHPSYVPAHIVRGRCHLDTGAEAEAEAAFRQVMELDPENVIALKGLADIAEHAGRFEEAGQRLERLLAVDRSNEEARAQLDRLRAMLATPSPATIDLQPEPPAAWTPVERAAPVPAPPPAEPEPAVIDLTWQPAAPLVEPPPVEPAVEEAEIFVVLDERAEEERTAGPVAETDAPKPETLAEYLWAATEEPLSEPPPAAEPAWAARQDAPVEPLRTPEPEPEEAGAEVSWEVEVREETAIFIDGTARAVGPYEAPEAAAPEPAMPAEAEVTPTEPADAAAAAEPDLDREPGLAGEPELVVTETMAEVFLRQGHKELALAVYTQLAQREGGSERVRDAIDRLTAELRPAAPPRVPVYAAALTGGTSVRALFDTLLTAAPPERAPLEAVFGGEPPAAAAETPPEGGPSYDEFFGDDTAPPPGPAPARAAPAPSAAAGRDDIEDFNAWLRGLRR